MSKRKKSLSGEALGHEKRMKQTKEYVAPAASPPIRKHVEIEHTTTGPSFDSSPTSVLQTPKSILYKRQPEPKSDPMPSNLRAPSACKARSQSYNEEDLIPRCLAATSLKEQRSPRRLHALLGALASLVMCFIMLPYSAWTIPVQLDTTGAALSMSRAWVQGKATECHVASQDWMTAGMRALSARSISFDKTSIARSSGLFVIQKEKATESTDTWDPANPNLASLGSLHISSRASITTPNHAPLACKSNSWVGCGL